MKLKLYILLYILFTTTINATEILQKELNNISISTEIYPPISFSNKDGEPDGLAVEVALEIMKQLKMNQNIKVELWVRAYKKLTQGPNYLLFSVSRIETRENLFQWVGPIFNMETGFYTKKDSDIIINSLDDAKELSRIGTVLKSFDKQYLEEKKFNNLEASRHIHLNIRKLMKNRFEVISATNVTLKSMVEKAGYKMSDIKKVYNFLTVGAYFAFSKDVSSEVIKAWQNELDKMEKDGRLAAIQNKWLN